MLKIIITLYNDILERTANEIIENMDKHPTCISGIFIERSDKSDYTKSCKNCKHESYPKCPAHGDRLPWGWDSKKDYCSRYDFE
jgi:hypothetical protein